jgi:hypothetical protein
VVLRQYEQAASGDPGGRAALAEEVRHEARVLEGARAHGLPAPGPLAVSEDGEDAGGQPAILMTRPRLRARTCGRPRGASCKKTAAPRMRALSTATSSTSISCGRAAG